MTDHTGVSRPTMRLLWATVTVAAITLLLGVATLVSTAQGKMGIDAQRRSDEVTACRSEYRALIDSADLTASRTESERVDIIARVIVASVQGDEPGVAEAGRQLDAASDRISTARAHVVEATEGYADAVRLSRTDPARFLTECRRLR